jgi:hypothetical protein
MLATGHSNGSLYRSFAADEERLSGHRRRLRQAGQVKMFAKLSGLGKAYWKG